MRRKRRQYAGRREQAMDEKDKRLLSLLRQNARQPLVALARGIGLSRSATQERLDRLERSGAIAGYTVVEGMPSDGWQSAHFLVSFEPGVHCSKVVPSIRNIPFLTGIDSVAGSIDLIVRVDAHSVSDIEQARAAINETPGVSEVRTCVVLERHLT